MGRRFVHSVPANQDGLALTSGLVSGLVAGDVTGVDGSATDGDVLELDELQAPSARVAARISRASRDLKMASSFGGSTSP